MFIIPYRQNGQLNAETIYYGPFPTHEAAYAFLTSLPAIGVYNHEEHKGQHGHKFIVPLSPPISPAAAISAARITALNALSSSLTRDQYGPLVAAHALLDQCDSDQDRFLANRVITTFPNIIHY